MKIETEAKIQMLGFSILMALFLFVTYNDIIRIVGRFIEIRRKIARNLAIFFIL